MKKSDLYSLLPPIIFDLYRLCRPAKYGWFGNFNSWKEALQKSSGYNEEDIFSKTLSSILKVKSGEAQYERDSVLFDTIEYSYPLISILLWIYCMNDSSLDLIDFGGSLGTTYFQNRNYLDKLENIHWKIVEQPKFVDFGKANVEKDNLKFFNSIGDALDFSKSNTILFSSVIQYLENPVEIIETIISFRQIKYIIFDMVPFVIKGPDRITIQKVDPAIYKASYPMRFFNKARFLSYFRESFIKLIEFDSFIGEKLYIDNHLCGKYKGLLLCRN